MGCVERAQIGRMFAYEATEVIGAEDVVMAADVDAFVMSAKVTLPLRRRERQIWLYRYELSYHNGYTFMMQGPNSNGKNDVVASQTSFVSWKILEADSIYFRSCSNAADAEIKFQC